jgi:hypothetical protein
MKASITKIVLIIITLLIREGIGFCQGFVDLDFESAQIIPYTSSPIPNAIAVSNALPGWSVYFGTSQQMVINYNDPATGSTWVSLMATNGGQISGNYSVLLQGGGTASAAIITQTGVVPVDTKSLLFEAEPGPVVAAGSLVVSLGGQNIMFSALSTGSNYTLYGGNIPLAFAGQSEQLTFSALEQSGLNVNNWTVDDIQFSPSVVPEPGVAGLLGLGSLLFGLCRWKKIA